ncbi:ATP-binding cassette domain-containing protein [Sphingobacterium paramultivorum]|uniref:ATP-binding cassette domain-containing protein n=1 Tax=Sphingobacterium paramultivorum TaxID=2886510 RepID=A0A7G5E2K3_9SPHI|nr:ABC transporter ATP-binding protein [Sphingobacterium paramultivorum]QMV68228.1 ATP-binding cassette domain-containing protein [Sphingobacterium paramultivorum]WSO17146.1 ABC transporter ATP-binding protein [Sphingobacterium paramultivorum]
MLLEINHVTKDYANHRALDDVSIQIPKGKIFGLLGPNGAGKTSLIRIINQITAPDSGEILFNGEALGPQHIAQIGYLPEERGLYKKMKIGDQMLYLAQLKGLSKREALARIQDWCQRLDITSWLDKKIEDLSKGMQQKVQFVATVIHQPELIILDEPFSGFDPVNANIIKEQILRLNQEGATIIFSTHRMETVEELCDNIALINRSKKILDGSVQEIKKEYRNQTYQLEYTANEDNFLLSDDTLFEVITSTKHEKTYITTIKLNNNNHINDVLMRYIPQIQLNQLIEIVPSMADIFIQKVTQVSPLSQDHA